MHSRRARPLSAASESRSISKEQGDAGRFRERERCHSGAGLLRNLPANAPAIALKGRGSADWDVWLFHDRCQAPGDVEHDHLERNHQALELGVARLRLRRATTMVPSCDVKGWVACSVFTIVVQVDFDLIEFWDSTTPHHVYGSSSWCSS